MKKLLHMWDMIRCFVFGHQLFTIKSYTSGSHVRCARCGNEYILTRNHLKRIKPDD